MRFLLRAQLASDRFITSGKGVPPGVQVSQYGPMGLFAARVLADDGLEVTVVDEGLGAGGRLATRRLGGSAAGACSTTARRSSSR